MTLKQITRLTNHYTTRLESFSLDFNYANDYPTLTYYDSDVSDGDPDQIYNEFNNSTIALIESINRIGPLRRLMLSGTFSGLYNTRLDLSRLDTLVTHDLSYTGLISESLVHAPERANVRVVSATPLQLREALAWNAQLAGNCVRFTFVERFYYNFYEDLWQFCGRFVSLTTLQLNLSYVYVMQRCRQYSPEITHWARCLSQLTHLIHLDLNVGIIPKEDRQPQLPLAQVPSVRLLTLAMETRSHSDTQRLHIDEILPNLQVLHLKHRAYQCDECGYGHSRVGGLVEFAVIPQTIDGTTAADDGANSKHQSTHHPLLENCARLVREPLRRCANVHTVKLDISVYSYQLKFFYLEASTN